MKMEKLKQTICNFLDCCAPFRQIEQDYEQTKEQVERLQQKNLQLQTERDTAVESIDIIQTQLEAIKDEFENEVDMFAEDKWIKVQNRVYTNKYDYRGEEVPVSINEYIQPRSYSVLNFFKNIHEQEYTNTYQAVRDVGNKIARRVKWTSDRNLHNSADYYQAPRDTLSDGKGDCEDHAFILTSALPRQTAVAYGFYGNGVGHAFNVFIHRGDLWIADTVKHKAELHLYNSDDHTYKIHFVVTPKHTYMLKMGVEFGKLAGWLPEVNE